MALSKLGCYIEQCDLRNADGFLGESGVVGLSTTKQIMGVANNPCQIKSR